MGGFYSSSKKDFQSVTPYSGNENDHGIKKIKLENESNNNNNNNNLRGNSEKRVTPIVPKREQSLGPGWIVNLDRFNFDYTEGQHRRTLMANCEDECSEITDFLFVGGAKIAASREILREHDITRIINLAPSVVENYFIDEPEFTYLVIDMLDGRQDDISWFICEIIRFIEVGRHGKCKTLIHCEKGISRSCSFAIAYLMWASEYSWQTALDYVVGCRPACAPNTSFTCNLIEIDDLLNGESRNIPIFYRLASHRPGDTNTPVLKLIRSPETRKILLPRSNHFSSNGVYIVRPARSRCKVLYVWKGRYADPNSLKIACMLAEQMVGILSNADTIEVIDDIAEPPSFRDHIIQEGNGLNRNQVDYDDLFKGTKESLDNVTRRHSICGMLKEKIPSQSTQCSQPILYVDHDDKFSRRSLHSSTFDTDSGEIRGEEYVNATTPNISTNPPTISPSSSQKLTLVLKHNLQVHSSHSSLSVDRPILRNLTTTDIDEGDHRYSSRIDYNARYNLNNMPPLVRIGSITASSIAESRNQSFSQRNNNQISDTPQETPTTTIRTVDSLTPSKLPKPLKPMLYQCIPIEDYDRSDDNKYWEWQRLKIYDDDDLQETSLLFLWHPTSRHTLWLGSSWKPSHGYNESDIDSIKSFVVDKISLGDMCMDEDAFQNLIYSSDTIIQRQGQEKDTWWDDFYEGL